MDLPQCWLIVDLKIGLQNHTFKYKVAACLERDCGGVVNEHQDSPTECGNALELNV